MQELNIEKFDPLKAEITELVENIKKTVASSSDATGYDLMKENKKVLQDKRIEMVARMKEERAGALKFQKGVIQLEKDLLAIISPVEDELKEKITKIDDKKKREERLEMLPERKEKLATIGIIEMHDDKILDMDEKKFAEFFVDEKMKYLEKKQEEIEENVRIAKEEQEEKEKIERQKAMRVHNDRRNILIPFWNFVGEEHKSGDLGELSDESFEIILNDAKKLKEEKEEADEKQRQAEIEEQSKQAATLERIRIENANKEKEAQEKREQKNLARRKKYQEFLKENGVTNDNANVDFYQKVEGKRVTLFKKIAEFNG